MNVRKGLYRGNLPLPPCIKIKPDTLAKGGTYLAGEEPKPRPTKHVSGGTRFLQREPIKDRFYGE